MKKIYTYLIFSFALLCSTSLIAQTNEKARETAVMIADRILKSTTYDFVDKWQDLHIAQKRTFK